MSAVQVELASSADAEALDAVARAAGLSLDSRKELARGYARLALVRDAQGVPAAFLLTWHVVDELHVVDVASHPRFRRRGAARALVADALAHAESVGVRLVLLEVRRSNHAALALYRAFGFWVAAIRRGYYSGPPEDGIEMRIELDPTTGLVVPRSDDLPLSE